MRAMKIGLAAFLFCASFSIAVADDAASIHIHLISGSKEYRSEDSLKSFKAEFESKYRATVTASWVSDGAKDLPNIEEIPKAGLTGDFRAANETAGRANEGDSQTLGIGESLW